MSTRKVLFYAIAAVLGGCVPVMSLHQLYTDKDTMFTGKLVGTWSDDSNGVWDFKPSPDAKKAYLLTFTGGEKPNEKGRFLAYLVQLQDHLFLDVSPALDVEGLIVEDKNKIDWLYNMLFLVPAHTFIKVNSIEPQLKMQLTDDDEMKKLLDEDPNAVRHEKIEGDKFVLTASTPELQKFVLKYADDKRVFGAEGVLNRKDANEPNSPPAGRKEN